MVRAERRGRNMPMKARILALTLGVLGLGAVLLVERPARTEEAPPPPDGVEVLARGPVHEAFAEPLDFRPQPGHVVKKQPPEPVDEMPPDQKPEGDDVSWIPGYWHWDDDQDDFLW